MHISEHEQHCVKKLGAPFTKIHGFLDQYFDQTPGPVHRVILHHRLGIEFGIAKFGESAREALELHVLDDFEFIPDTPLEVAQMMVDQDFLSLHEINVLQPILDSLWPGRFKLS
jgi:hypothetical protein